jgi:hypothetical protein
VRRISGDENLASTAAFVQLEMLREIRGQFRRTKPNEGSRVQIHVHTQVSRFPRISENRAKIARVRAICDRTWDPESVSGRANHENSADPIPARFC